MNTLEVEAAVKSLDGRWFGGKMIRADLYSQEKFEANDLTHWLTYNFYVNDISTQAVIIAIAS